MNTEKITDPDDDEKSDLFHNSFGIDLSSFVISSALHMLMLQTK